MLGGSVDIAAIERISKKEGIAGARNLVNFVRRNNERALIVLLDSNEGKGASKNGGVCVIDEHGEIANATRLAGLAVAVPLHHIVGFGNPPNSRRRFGDLEVGGCGKRGEEQREKGTE